MNNEIKNLITIIVPVFNVESYVERCINSIINQTYKKIEVIIIDDGSYDRSGEICDCLAQKDDRIKVFHTINLGLSSARNKALNKALGQYIMFVDAGDYLEESICEKLLTALGDADCCFGGFVSVDEFNHKIQYNLDKLTVLSGKEALRKRYLDNNIDLNIVNVWGKLYRKDMWESKAFNDGLYYEDLDIMPYLYLPCDKIVIIPDIGYYYTIRKGSLSHGEGQDDKRYRDSLL